MKASQLILVAFTAAITAGLYFFGDRKTPLKPTTEGTSAMSARAQVSLKDSIVIFKEKLLENDLAQLESLEGTMNAAEPGSAEHNASLLDLAKFWELKKALPPSSFYFTEYAKATDNAESWKEASKRNYLAFKAANDSIWRPYFTDKAIASLEKTINFVPLDFESKIQLADCLIEGKNEVMQGVLLLREVVDEEPENIPANIQLGRLSIVSGQFDKAKQRLNKVLSVEPENTEALYFLGETHVALEENEEAIAVFKRCAELVDDPRFKRELDKYLNKVINNKL